MGLSSKELRVLDSGYSAVSNQEPYILTAEIEDFCSSLEQRYVTYPLLLCSCNNVKDVAEFSI